MTTSVAKPQTEPQQRDFTTHRRRYRRYLIGIPLVLVILLVLTGIGAYVYSALILNSVESTPVTASSNTFDGQYLLTVSDADMVGTAYANGVLMQIPGQRDALTTITLPLNNTEPQLTETFVSNSVTSWPQVMATSSNGERVYIVETAAEIADDVEEYPDLQSNPPNGRSLTVVEIATGDAQVYDVIDYASHVAIHPHERFVAIGAATNGEQLAILPVTTIDDANSYQFFAIETSSGTRADEITSVNWHPSGDYLAVGVDRSELVFFEVVVDDDGTVGLRQHGDYLELGNTITYGQFTADGNFYLTAEINWASIPGQLGYVFNPPGEMISIQFDSASADHREVSRVEVGQSPEGFAVSPDESLVVTVDMRRTYLPDNLSFIPGTDLNSLSLLTFNNTTGALGLVEQYGFEGVLPEHAVFDADGDALAVVVYNERENPMEQGYIEFWNVLQGDEQPTLERTGRRINVTRGPHAIALIP